MFKYYSYRNEDKTTTLKLAIQIPAPYIDFSEFYFPEKTNVAPKIERITPTENKNLFYNEYRYPLVTKYYQPRIENDELYGDLYSYKQNKFQRLFANLEALPKLAEYLSLKDKPQSFTS